MADIYFRPDGPNRFQIRSAAGLTLPSAWLDQEYNRIYTYLNTMEAGGATTGSEWATVNVDATRSSTTVFTVEGDYSGVFEALRAIRLTDDNDGQAISHIKSSTYVGGTNLTTVTLYDAIVPTTIKAIDVGLIGSEAQPIPSLSYTTRTSGYTVTAGDQVIFVDDSTIGNLQLVYDDNQVNGSGYYALMITLPVASDFPGKLLCIKKIGGSYRTIVSSTFTHTTSTVGTETTHINTYTFQIYGDTDAKNRVTLYGIGDCYWLFSNGNRWYELTPEASETVKGITRFATSEEMTLTAQQIEDGETLSKNLAVSPYQADKEYVRTDASNIRFASNYIYKAPNGVAALINNQIVVYNGLGLNMPEGRDANAVLQSEKVELSQNYTFSPVEVTDKPKYLFVEYNPSNESISLRSVLAQNFFIGYATPFVRGTSTGDVILWFDYNTNTIKESTDNGANWTTFHGSGPICVYRGNGTYITELRSYSATGFLTREDLETIYREARDWEAPDYNAGVSLLSNYDNVIATRGWVWAWVNTRGTSSDIMINGISYPFGVYDADDASSAEVFLPVSIGDVVNLNGSWRDARFIFFPCRRLR